MSNTAGAKFCKRCGSPLAVDASVAVASQVEAAPKSTPAIARVSAPSTPIAAHVDPAESNDQPTSDGVGAPTTAAVPRQPDAEPPEAPASTSPPVSAPQPPQSSATSREPVRDGMPGWMLGIIVALAVVILGGAGVFAYFTLAKDQPKDVAAAASASTLAPAASAAMPTVVPSQTIADHAVPVSSGVAKAVAPKAVLPTVPAVAVAPATPASPGARSPAAPRHAPTASVAPRVAKSRSRARPVERTLKVAAGLVEKGESAFQRQDYSSAIANANAALAVRPGYASARRLLDRAESAQQAAMHSISIH